ncbi:MAG: ABC transporter ATP-binding protein [Anaerolineae bacterium]|nr:ABC transporter ATP-binding protein [Gemmatimonadaceae bacterium]
MTAIEAHGLTRAFGRRMAVDGVDLSIASGDCMAIFGPNGAGKTTLLRLLGGLLKPSAGTATIGGVRIPSGDEGRGAVGVIAHATMLYGALSGRENVEFAARLHGVRNYRDAATAALDKMHVLDRASAPVRALSRGMQQRVAIARAIVHAPSVILLDEPFTGLDYAGASALTVLLGTLRVGGAALVLVTHNIAEGLAIATHASIMREGRFARSEKRASIDADRYQSEYRELVSHGT